MHLTRTRDINLFAPVPLTIASGGQSYTFQRFPTARPISRATGQSYNRISLFESASKSLYHGLAIQATQRLTRGFQFIAAYTYSKAKDDRPDQTIVVFGAVETVQKLVVAGLVDEFWLKVNPVALGRGGALFDSRIPAMELELQTARGYISGKVDLIHQNADRS